MDTSFLNFSKHRLGKFSSLGISKGFFFMILIFSLVPSQKGFANYIQQDLTITGTVKDKDGMPLPGVTVLEKNTKNGTQTDFDGNYSLKVSSENATIVFSYVGMKTIEKSVKGKSTINAEMLMGQQSLGEVLVVGYGKQRKADLTSSISTVNADDLKDLPVPGVEQALQGRAAGVTVTSSSGLPGSPVSIRIRGIGSVNNNNPLYVVDGVPLKDINFLNPSDIASLQVLKDASAAAIYGSRGANGVILITTKKGKKGKPKVAFDEYYGVSKPWQDYHPAGADEYLDMARLLNGKNSSAYANAKAEYDKGYNTNWWDETIKTAVVQKYNLTISGGDKNAHYNVGVGYLDQKGSVKPSGFSRLSARLNADFKISEHIKVGENLGISNEKRDNTVNNILQPIEQYDPLVPVIDPNRDQSDPYSKFGNSDITFGSNPLALLARKIGGNKKLRLVGNAYAEITLLDGLVFKSNYGFDVQRTDTHSFSPIYYFDPSDKNDEASVSSGSSSSDGWTWSNTLTWNKSFGKHKFTLLAGTQSEQTKSHFVNGSKFGQPGNDDRFQYIDAGTEGALINGSASEYSLNSYFGRLNYNFADKYLFSASVRRDGSSNFAEGHRWGTFPAVSAGWVISKENFWSNLDIPWFSNLKLRGGWGQIGNQAIPPGAYTSYVSGGIIRRYVLGPDNNIVQGYAISNTGNSEIKWETSEQSNIGLELGFLKGALTAEAEYYNKKTKDMLIAYPVANTFGASSPYVNAGSVENKGIELTLNYKGNIGKLKYIIGGNISHYKNEVTSLGAGQPYVESVPGARVTGASRTAVGHPIGEFYGWKTAGIFQSQAEVDAYTNNNGDLIQPNASPGDFRFADINGDGTINDSDKTTIGSPHPDFTYGGNIQLNYGNFGLTVFLQGSVGNKLFNINKYITRRPLGFDNVEAGATYAAWTPENGSNTQPKASLSDPNNNYRASDYYVEDGSYMRVKNVQLGYNLPSDLLEKIKVSRLRIYIAAQNLFTFTDYSGLDPEIGAFSVGDEGQRQRLMGTDYFSFPQSRVFQVGLNIGF